MKVLKYIFQILIVLAVLATENIASQASIAYNSTGSYSEVCGNITESSRQWVLDTFGQHDNIEDLMWAVEKFACENFTYSTDSLQPSQRMMQHFNMQDFLGTGYRGVCFDFACFCKNVLLICCEAQQIPADVHICEIRYSLTGAHAYNYITDGNGNTYYLDLTTDVTAYQNGQTQNVRGPLPLGSKRMEEFEALLYPDGIWYRILR